jgi:hypothetical protein
MRCWTSACTRSYTSSTIHVKQENLELEERVVMIATLKQQLQVPPAPAAPTESDAVSDVDEE